MIFKVERSSDCFGDPPKIESLNTLEELLEFVDKVGHSVIVTYRPDLKIKKLEIYDDWRE
jgi:hypothetical protein